MFKKENPVLRISDNNPINNQNNELPFKRSRKGRRSSHVCKYCRVVQLVSRVLLSVTSPTAVRQAALSSTILPTLLKFMSIELGMPSNHLTCPQSFPASGSFSVSQL